ncbi:uncharacterized protein [Magallana gigas]|uniref:Uncharacterized protein n=1 Tax=Magallana gigas TaxID=29159 RepID=K1RFX6_MAGGI|nr:uncharacterized protein LOC105325887 isoform X2 [Crassostrea gigas]|eukprot:XP_011423928.1 PREDICTED: uncharacterized protein LOC105325887 isoform X1 [Crassostrea gigas]
MAGFRSAGTLVKIVFILVISAVLFHLIGFSTVSWSHAHSADQYGHRHITYLGLWIACDPHCFRLSPGFGWFGATQALETIGLVAGFIGLILIVLYIFINKLAGNRTLFITSLVAVGIAAGSTLLGVVIYGVHGSALSWSFALAVIGGLLYLVTMALMLVHVSKPNAI